MNDKYNKSQLDTLDEILRPLELKWNDYKLNDKLDWYDEHLLISTPDFLRYLAGRATASQFVEFYGDEREERFDAIYGDGQWKQDNTYNYNEPYSADMVVVQPLSPDEAMAYTVAFAPHYGGDVRGNYGDFVVLTFKDFYAYIDACDEFFKEHAYSFELDGRSFSCQYNGAGEHYTLFERGGEFQSDGFLPAFGSEEEFLESVRKELKHE